MIAKPTPRPRVRKPLKSKPRGVNLSLRQSVSERDGYVCQWCRVPGGALDPHHIQRRSQGGKDTLDNLIPLHRQCHRYIHEHPSEAYDAGFLVRSDGALHGRVK
jgi:5-methylcytosine-specific restriction endonuclease McrA